LPLACVKLRLYLFCYFLLYALNVFDYTDCLMPRQKVDPLHRQRVAQACDSCKGAKKSAMAPCLANSVNPAGARAAVTPNAAERFHLQRMPEMSAEVAKCVRLGLNRIKLPRKKPIRRSRLIAVLQALLMFSKRQG
jgi:hypothetical protein